MMIRRTETEIASDLLGQIYDAAIDQAQWPSVLEYASEFVGGAAASIYSKNAAGKTGHTIFGWNLESAKGYFNEYARIDPFTTTQFLFDVGEVYSIADCVPAEEYRETRVYKEWVKPQGWVDYLAATLDKSATSFSALGFFRSEQQGLVDEEMRERMQLIVPHVRRAVLIGNVLDLKSARAAAFTETLHGLAAGVFLVDEASRILFANVSGQSLLDEGKILRSKNNMLATVDPRPGAVLADVIVSAGAGDAAVGVNGIAIPLSSPPQPPWLAHVLPLTSGVRRAAWSTRAAAAAVVVRSASTETPSSIETMSRIYRLTPSELRVLAAMAEVGGIAAVADVLGISAATVRTHLQNLFVKTGTNRQTDLVKLVVVHASPFGKS